MTPLITIATFGAALLVVSAIGTFLLGRLAVHASILRSSALKMLLYIVVVLAGMFVVIAPGIIIALSYLEHIPPLRMGLYPRVITEPSVLIVYLVYWAVIYLSFRAGIGRARWNG